MLCKFILVFATILLFHSAYSAYEYLAYVKASGRSESSLPQDIIVECVLSVVFGILGASLNAPELKEITWRSEMKKRKIDEIDARLGFANYTHRGSILYGTSATD